MRHLYILSRILLIICIIIAPAGLDAKKDDHSTKNDSIHSFSHDQLKRGERLFYGLLPMGENAVSCASCHNTSEIDTLNWNPSAYDISLISHGQTLEEFTGTLLNPARTRLMEVHVNYDLSQDDIALIKGFLEEVSHEGLIGKKPVITNRFLYIVAFLLIFIALTDLAITKRLRFRFIHGLVILAAFVYIAKVTAHEAIAVGRSPGYAPDQPVKFSHGIHAGQNKTDCQYCHSTAAYSKSAGIPSVNVCLNCHEYVVKEGTRSGTFEINKVLAAAAENRPLEWTRVYNLWDHVYFSHAQHVSAGKIECQECHGPVEEMDILKLNNTMAMGWCVNCHRDTEIQLVDNEFYWQYEKLHRDLKAGKIDRITVDAVGGIECMKCHY